MIATELERLTNEMKAMTDILKIFEAQKEVNNAMTEALKRLMSEIEDLNERVKELENGTDDCN